MQQKSISSVVLTILIYLTVMSSILAVSNVFCDYMMAMKRYASMGGAIGCVVVVVFMSSVQKIHCDFYDFLRKVSWAIIVSCTLEILFVFGQLVGLFGRLSEFGIGTFDNVAGFSSCICFGLAFLIREFGNSKKADLLLAFVALLFLSAVLYSMSRTALLSLGVVCFFVFLQYRYFSPRICKNKYNLVTVNFFQKLPVQRIRRSSVIAVLVLICLFCVLMYMKTSSTIGRMFILQNTWELVLKKPLFGYGADGFASQYMYQQASFFKACPYDVHSVLADNIHHPLSEFALVAVNWGLLGLLLCLLIIGAIYVYAVKHLNSEVCFGIELLTLVLFFSLFSYPFFYPFTWIVLCMSFLCIFRSKRLSSALFKVSIVVLPIATYILLISFMNSLQYRKARDCSEKLKYGLALPMYQRLYNRCHTDGAFLYDYAYCLMNAMKYKEAKTIIEQASVYLADYNVVMLKGYIYEGLQEYKKSLREYELAHNMCPSRILPLYEKFRLYGMMGDYTAVNRIQCYVASMPCKIESDSFREMRDAIMNYKK